MSAWSVAEVVAHAPGPVIGSNGAAIAVEPAVGRIVCGAGDVEPDLARRELRPGPAVNGPPTAAAFGHVCV